ncbi:MAG: hypothetical protein AAFP69_13785, partial [Planctomycetota bacterium]
RRVNAYVVDHSHFKDQDRMLSRLDDLPMVEIDRVPSGSVEWVESFTDPVDGYVGPAAIAPVTVHGRQGEERQTQFMLVLHR